MYNLKYLISGISLLWIAFAFKVTEKPVALNRFQPQDSKIEWGEKVKLSWSDFKANANTDSPFSAESSLQVSYRMKIEQTGSAVNVKFMVDCYFEPVESWVKKENKSDDLLLHEQLHFDVAEYFARKLRREFEQHEYTLKNYKDKSTDIFDKVFKEYSEFQAKYDRETSHGKNKEQQQRWNKIVADLLAKSVAYAKK